MAEKFVSDVEFSPDGSKLVMAAGHDKDGLSKGESACRSFDDTDAAVVVDSSTEAHRAAAEGRQHSELLA